MSGGVNAIGNLQGKVDADNNLCVFVSGGSGTPGSPNTSVQFNNAGSFAGSADLTFDDATDTLTIGDYPLVAEPTEFNIVAPLGGDLYFASNDDAGPSASVWLKANGELEFDTTGAVLVNAPRVEVESALTDADTPPTSYVFTQTLISKTNAALPGTFLGNGLGSAVYFGTADTTTAAATVGTAHATAAAMIVVGNGDADNEQATYTGGLTVNIGTGYSQGAGPTGRAWFTDWQVIGPVAVQPNALNGATLVFQNNYNGTAADNPMAGLALVAGYGFGDATHAAADSYPIDHALFIGGFSHATTDKIGWTTGIQIGGTGSAWNVASQVGTGINIRDYKTAAININNTDDVAAPSIIFDTFLQTSEMASAPAAPAANGARIYCVDNGGKTELLAIFNTGSPVRIVIQP